MIKCKIIWKPVKGFEGYYEVSDLGVIKSLHKRNLGKKIKQRVDRGYYYTVRLNKNGVEYTKYIHRLLAETFLPNPLHKSFVNHINGNQLDNDLNNLEWVSHSENISHAFKAGLCKIPDHLKKKIVDTSTGKAFHSIRDAAKLNNLTYSTCKNYLNGNRKNPTSLKKVS
jgi:hypothetical protein